jgi:Uncharacterized conserved protein
MNKKYLIPVIAFSAVFLSVFIVANFLSVKKVILNRDQLSTETWLEVEKNETVKICIDSKVRTWETSLDSEVLNDSCLKIQIPTLIGVYPIHVQFPDTDSAYKINLAVGMKYLDFKNEEVHYGYDLLLKAELSRKNVSISGKYLVDKYPVTNCEILHTLWEDIPSFSTSLDSLNNDFIKSWMLRKHNHDFDEKCSIHDSAVTLFPLYLAMKYANARSIQEGLKPYYVFSKITRKIIKIKSEIRHDRTQDGVSIWPDEKHKYTIVYDDFIEHEERNINVIVDSTSDGYRLPYYDEWEMLARGGDKSKNVPWGDSASFHEASKYAKLCIEIKGDAWKEINLIDIPFVPFNFCRWGGYNESGPVGKLKPNGYGLYDMFGLVQEHVLLEMHNDWEAPSNMILRGPYTEFGPRTPETCVGQCPSCLKGGSLYSDWKSIDYSYVSIDEYPRSGGFRLIRNIGNNAKWTEVKSK